MCFSIIELAYLKQKRKEEYQNNKKINTYQVFYDVVLLNHRLFCYRQIIINDMNLNYISFKDINIKNLYR